VPLWVTGAGGDALDLCGERRITRPQMVKDLPVASHMLTNERSCDYHQRHSGCRRGLEVLTKCEVPQPTPADDGAGEAEEGFVDVVADLPADAQPAEPVQQGDGLLHDPAVDAQARAVLGGAAGDDRGDPGGLDLLAVFIVVVAAVGVDGIRAAPRPSAAPAHGRDGLDEGQELGDVVTVAAGQCHRQRDAVRFGDQVVLRARPGTIDRARTGFGPPLSART